MESLLAFSVLFLFLPLGLERRRRGRDDLSRRTCGHVAAGLVGTGRRVGCWDDAIGLQRQMSLEVGGWWLLSFS